MSEIHLWRWRYTATDGPNFGKRVETRWHMSEENAARYKDAEKIEGTLEIRKPLGSTSGFLRSQPKSEPGPSTPSRGNSSDL